MRKKFTILVVLMMIAAAIIAGCTVSSGVFIGMSEQSGDTSLSASYVSFDGSLARSVSLKAGDEVRFSYEGGEGLHAAVRQGGEELGEIADGSSFIAPEDGSYMFTVEGEAKNGTFALSWEIE
jgi:hypothetical protein